MSADHHRAGCACATCFCRTPDEVRAERDSLREELATTRATVAVFEESLAAVLKTRPATVKERAAAYVPMAMRDERLREQHAAAERAFAQAMAENERLQRDLTAAETDRDAWMDECHTARASLDVAVCDVVQARCERDHATRALATAVMLAVAEEREACARLASSYDPGSRAGSEISDAIRARGGK